MRVRGDARGGAASGARRLRALTATRSSIGWPPADEDAWQSRCGWSSIASAIAWSRPRSGTSRTAPNSCARSRTAAGAREAYLRILSWTSEEVDGEHPDLPVLAGSLAFADALFLQGLYLGGLAGLHDGIAVHPYSARPDRGTVATPPAAITFDGDRQFGFRSGIEAIRDRDGGERRGGPADLDHRVRVGRLPARRAALRRLRRAARRSGRPTPSSSPGATLRSPRSSCTSSSTATTSHSARCAPTAPPVRSSTRSTGRAAARRGRAARGAC